jgi:hypothetical protein
MRGSRFERFGKARSLPPFLLNPSACVTAAHETPSRRATTARVSPARPRAWRGTSRRTEGVAVVASAALRRSDHVAMPRGRSGIGVRAPSDDASVAASGSTVGSRSCPPRSCCFRSCASRLPVDRLRDRARRQRATRSQLVLLQRSFAHRRRPRMQPSAIAGRWPAARTRNCGTWLPARTGQPGPGRCTSRRRWLSTSSRRAPIGSGAT